MAVRSGYRCKLWVFSIERGWKQEREALFLIRSRELIWKIDPHKYRLISKYPYRATGKVAGKAVTYDRSKRAFSRVKHFSGLLM